MDFKHQIELSSSVSDCESGITGSCCPTSSATSRIRRQGIFNEGVAVEIEEGERPYELIRRRFLAGVGDTAVVTAVHRRNWSVNPSSMARIQAFQVHLKGLENKYGGGNGGGSTNMKFGWYGGDKRKIERILDHGFGFQDLLLNNHGAILLSPDDSPVPSVEDSSPDEDGLRHVLLCRVLLGRSELVHIGSGQTHPSSDAFDSGVDSYDKPSKYVIWSTNMNTHILPEYIVTFKANATAAQSPSKGVFPKTQNGIRMPTSPWISFPALISVLARYLPSDAVALISKYHKDYKEKKISRPDLIEKVRHIAGDKLLVAVIKSFKSVKESRMSHHNTNK
ncbi:putative inactive poly [ADP-ribose] polymerase SRO5 [Silene latifolia]|uniref:putative inactive poly [ADP-ribose] polymerase SRO5 n=1 Tax=Silene latifolia TaxID=37657 RepID=UPI003D77E8A0